jgi:hypothetical protein
VSFYFFSAPSSSDAGSGFSLAGVLLFHAGGTHIGAGFCFFGGVYSFFSDAASPPSSSGASATRGAFSDFLEDSGSLVSVAFSHFSFANSASSLDIFFCLAVS